MKKINVLISKASDRFYSVHCVDKMFSGGGNTAIDAKNNMIEQMQFYKQIAIEEGFDYPKFLDGKFEIVYTLDTKSLLEYYAGMLALAGLERIMELFTRKKYTTACTSGKNRKRITRSWKRITICFALICCLTITVSLLR